MCYHKTISMVEQDSEDNLDSALCSKSVWSYKINIKGKEIVFRLDTHAEATVSKETWEELENQHFNQQIKICLVLPAKQAVFRSLVVTLPTRENLHSSQQLWWITSNNLLGLPAITNLHSGENRCSSDAVNT